VLVVGRSDRVSYSWLDSTKGLGSASGQGVIPSFTLSSITHCSGLNNSINLPCVTLTGLIPHNTTLTSGVNTSHIHNHTHY